MPQELHVVRCYNCEAFQVDIVKKIPKWICKMCGEKQSLKKVYAKGTGKECREFVQDLNQQRLLIKQNTTNEVETTRDCSNDIDEADLDEQICKKPKLGINDDLSKKTSKWDEFLCNRKSNLTLINCNEDEKKCTELEDILQNLNDKSCDKVETQNTSETKMKQNNDVSSNFYKRRFESIGDFDFDLEF